MSSVQVTIAGRSYRMACEDGQEDHLRALAEEFDQRITAVRGDLGEIGDARLTVVAALMLSDELADTKQRLARAEEEHAARLRELQAEIAEAKDSNAGAAVRQQATQAAIVSALNSAAERIERVTKGLNSTLTSGVPMG
jgi:cell division protein ZapA